MSAPDYLLTVREIADELRVSIDTVHRLIDRGQLPAIVFGRSKRVTRSTLDEFKTAHLTVRESA